MNSVGDRGTGGVGSKGSNFDVVFGEFEDNSTLEASDFMTLMVTQMQNQDFTDPMDNSDMINQMAQFSNMEMMQQMAGHSRTSYAVSLVGKNVTASRFSVSGDLDTTTGIVEKVSLVEDEYIMYIGDKTYTMEQIMTIGTVEVSEVDPSDYDLSMKDITDTTATVGWEIPTEDFEKANGLRYSVYYSKDDTDFDTVEAVEKGTLAGEKNRKDVVEADLELLDTGTKYYVNVVVTDPQGRKSVFKPMDFTTHP